MLYQIQGVVLVLGDVRGNKVSNSGSVYPGLDRGDGCKLNLLSLMAFASSWLFNSLFACSSLFSSSPMDSFEKIVDGVPTGLGRILEFPDLDGDEPGLKLIGAAPSCVPASLSDGPVKRCTTSLKVFESVCTNVVNGLPPATPWLAGVSMDYYYLVRQALYQSDRP
ncbi:hypothetical protein Pint_27557 [Pistacia integerrima]|uniref:Uncharacterized protein n=1 Tax=Pistacia integerrima TaxID=434235 RepID=A0ACC0YNR8_9ROSI|nr:hypothetical protein Pint_27557 [Pistacia integerrima]